MDEHTTSSSFTAGVFARITGEVQGVSYRAAAQRQAEDLDLTGWVRNTDDGAVELLIGGDGPAVDALLRWCHRGPSAAEVAEVQTREAAAEELDTLPGSGFDIRR